MKHAGEAQQEATHCPKCGGVMGFEQFRGASSEVMPWSYAGWRCVQCGMVIDPIILANRMKGRPPNTPGEGKGGGPGDHHRQ